MSMTSRMLFLKINVIYIWKQSILVVGTRQWYLSVRHCTLVPLSYSGGRPYVWHHQQIRLHDGRYWALVFLGETAASWFIVLSEAICCPCVAYGLSAVYCYRRIVSEDLCPGILDVAAALAWSGTWRAEAAGSVPRDESGQIYPGTALYMGEGGVYRSTQVYQAKHMVLCDHMTRISTIKVDLYHLSSPGRLW